MSLKDTIYGTWTLVECVQIRDDGATTYPLGKNAKGFIIYSPDGYMSAHLEANERPKFNSPSPFEGTPIEFKNAASQCLAYAGPYTLDEKAKTLIHKIEVSLFPNWIGQSQTRIIEFEGQNLILKTGQPFPVGDRLYTAKIVWSRI